MENSLAEQDLQVLVGNKSMISQQCALAAKEANRLLVCIRQSTASRSVEVIPTLFSVLLRHIWSAVPSAGLPGTRETVMS